MSLGVQSELLDYRYCSITQSTLSVDDPRSDLHSLRLERRCYAMSLLLKPIMFEQVHIEYVCII